MDQKVKCQDLTPRVPRARSQVNVVNEQKKIHVDLKRIRAAAERALASRRSRGLLNLLITDDRRISRLHWKHMKIKGPTDVMAFGMREGKKIVGSQNVFGDVVLSAETARRTARELGISVQEEIERYVIHGILHLLGYQDDTPAKAKRMHKKQEEILTSV